MAAVDGCVVLLFCFLFCFFLFQFVSLVLLCFGHSVTSSDSFPKPYFWSAMLGYFLGLSVTVAIMYYFDHAQVFYVCLFHVCIDLIVLPGERGGGGGRGQTFIFMCCVVFHVFDFLFVRLQQPALLYLVPFVCAAVLICALVRGEVGAWFHFTEEAEEKKGEEKVVEKVAKKNK